MNVVIYLSAGLTVVLAALCTLLYSRLTALHGQVKTHREQLDRIEIGMHAIADQHELMMQRFDQMATDVMQREIYQNSDNRHQHAIKDARAGCDVNLLVQRHGLSSDEAALIHALHGRQKPVSLAGLETEEASVDSWPGDI